MFKTIPFASRFKSACAVFALVACFGGCSTKSQLVGTWSHDLVSKAFGQSAVSGAETWEFRSDNTFRMSEGLRGGKGKYTVLDDDSIKIEFEDGATVTGKLDNKRLMINWGKAQSELYKE
jgi:hypothetical protein